VKLRPKLFGLLRNPSWNGIDEGHQCYSRSSMLHIPPTRESQHDCRLLGKPWTRVKTTVHTVFKTVDDNPPERVIPQDVRKLINTLDVWFWQHPKWMSQAPSKMAVGSYYHLFNHSFQLSHFPRPRSEVKVIHPNKVRTPIALKIYVR